jgi:hypothetical protein
MYRRGRSVRRPVLTNGQLVVALAGEEPVRCQVANGETFCRTCIGEATISLTYPIRTLYS